MTTFGKYVSGYGPIGAKLAIVGIAPGAEEVAADRPFVGPSGKILRRDLAEAGINLDDCYRTNVFKYKLPDNDFARFKEMGLSLPDAMNELTNEIHELNPNCILGLGDPVLYALANKSGKYNNVGVWRGSILQTLNRKAVFTWHPAAELHGSGEGTFASWQKYVRKFDIKRAVEESRTARLELPHRFIQIAQTSADLYRFIERNIEEQYVALDIESIESIPVCLGISFRPSEAMVVPLWNILPIEVINKKKPKKSYDYKLRISDIPRDDLAYIWRMLSAFLLNKLSIGGRQINFKKIGQNFKYDEAKLNNLGFYLDELFWDLMISAHCISPEMPKGLAFNTSIKTREPYYKFEGREFVPQRDKIEDFFNYNGKDACVTREIFNVDYAELNNIPYGIENVTWRNRLHKAYMFVDDVGFKIDEFQRKDLINKYVNRLVDLEVELFLLCKEFGVEEPVNVRSHPQVNRLIYLTLNIPARSGTGEQVLTGLLANVIKDKKKQRICELILEIRRVDKTLGYLKAEPDQDGRMKTTFLITGTENYRTSTNVLEPPIRPTQVGWAFQTVTKHGDVGQDLRSILVADRGYVIVNIDQSQAEARVCSLLAGDEDKLKAYDTKDVHAETAAKFFSAKPDQYSKKILGYECPERFVGKAQPLYSKILTPTGWVVMGDLKVGDAICNSYGSISKITGVYPQGIKETFEVEFSDGSKTQSCAQHYWAVRSPAGAWRGGPYQINSLRSLMNNLTNADGEYTKLIPIADAVELEEVPLDINPYVMGLMLGDGSFRQEYSYTYSSKDYQLVSHLESLLECKLGKTSDLYDYTIPAEQTKKFRIYGLHMKYSHEKFIPHDYKFNSIENRWRLLQGILDTDGTVNNRGTGVTLDTSSEQLANDVIHLVNSLGGIATLTTRIPNYTYQDEKKEGKISYRVFISNLSRCPFNLISKGMKWKPTRAYRRIVKITPIGETECQCISVDAEDSLYITDDFIVTHNTLRHAFHLDIGKREAMINVNTDARKYKIDINISEWFAQKCLDALARDTPKIPEVFHATIKELLARDRRLIGAYGASRYFYDDEGKDLWKGGYSFIPQSAVSDKTKQVILKITKYLWDVRIVVEAHDAIAMLIREKVLEERIAQIQEWFAEPIDFSRCSIPRRSLVIPTDVEIAYDYKNLRKYESRKINSIAS